MQRGAAARISSFARRLLGKASRPEAGREHFSAFKTSPLFDSVLAAQLAKTAGIAFDTLDNWYWSLPADKRPSFSPIFDPAYYGLKYPDIAASGIDRQMHYFLHGFHEARSPHPLIDGEFLGQARPDLFNQSADPSVLLLVAENDILPTSPYIDIDHYLAQSDRARKGGGVFFDLVEHGGAEQFSVNPFIDLDAYRQHYPDVPRGDYDALVHFITVGDPEGREAGDLFDSRWYAGAFPDVARAGFAPLYHFLRFGRFEGRSYRRTARTKAPSSVALGTSSIQGLRATTESQNETTTEYDNLTGALTHIRRQKVEAVKERDVRVANFEDGLPFNDLAFQSSPAPRLSIVVPAYNGVRETFECLWSVMKAPPSAPYELVLADDASPDEAMLAFGAVPGLTYIRQEKNLGFLRNCNSVFEHLKAPFILLLNSDTQVLPGALDSLLDEVADDPTVGAAGPMIIYPNGRVQEAGCIVNDDGSTEMVGLAMPQSDPVVLRSRDVDYCSGAALLLRRQAVKGPLFDEDYAPAYCEDVDLCLRISQAGYRIRYRHTARVIHHLSLSTRPEDEQKRVQLSYSNQQKMLEKWSFDLAKRNEVRVFAFYLPQFHPIPENDLWWGKGFTEWRNVAKATPKYDGHYQPHIPSDLGFYDLRMPEIMGEQFALARGYGVEGFCVYHYDFGGRRILSKPIENLLARPEIEFPFFICWANENWTKHWDGGSKEMLLEQDYSEASAVRLAADAVRMAKDARYITVNGKPMVAVYRPLLIPDPNAFAATVRAAFEQAGFSGVHLVYVESMEAIHAKRSPADLGFDACIEFPPQGVGVPNLEPTSALPEWNGSRYDYPETIKNIAVRGGASYPRYPGVFMSWDNTARQPNKGASFDGASPARFQAYCELKLAEAKAHHVGDERMMFVNAWNEWAEGAHLEPDLAYGHRWLESLRRAFAGAKARPATGRQQRS